MLLQKPFAYLVFILILCFGFQNTLAQEKLIKVVYKDGTIEKGLGRLASKNRLKFTPHLETKSQKISFDLIDHAIIGGNRYEQNGVKGEKKKIVAEVKVSGKVWLYEVSSYGYNASFPATGGAGNVGFGGYHYNINNFYVKYEGDSELIHLGSNQLFTKNFKQGASEFFKSCPELVEKIQNRELKRKDIIRIVRYFNLNCN